VGVSDPKLKGTFAVKVFLKLLIASCTAGLEKVESYFGTDIGWVLLDLE